jgi:4-hydroxythreonine-4-phosphate dehydrogenase
MDSYKPIIGISIGDINGIGPEIILKTFGDSRILDICTPVIFGNNKVLNFYRKALQDVNIIYNITKDLTKLNTKQVNVFSCWEEDVAVTPGMLNETGGKYAYLSLSAAGSSLKAGQIDALVTAPIHKQNIQNPNFKHTGHTPYLKELFAVKDVAMMLVADNMRVALLTEHIAIKDLAQHISKEAILSKLQIMQQSLKKDFGINKPTIAVLGLNPHAGDEGLVGKEEKEIIKPAIAEAKQKGIMCFGPYSADAFFARGSYQKVDAVLALYHDQGLIPFKSLAIGEGVNFTAGIAGVRTSPDHGTAFDIAGKGTADETSFREAVYTAVDIVRMRKEITEQYANPLKRRSAFVLKGAKDEAIPLDEK